jgi:hypothetical protein
MQQLTLRMPKSTASLLVWWQSVESLNRWKLQTRTTNVMQIAIKTGSFKMSRRHLVHEAAFFNPTAALALSMTRQAARGKVSSAFRDRRKFK